MTVPDRSETDPSGADDPDAQSFEALLSRGGPIAASDPRRAVALYRDWLERNASHPQAFVADYNLALVAHSIGETAVAVEALERVIAAAPDFHRAHVALGSILEAAGVADRAVLAWATLSQRLSHVTRDALSTRAFLHKQIGRVFHAAGVPEVASDQLGRSLALDPSQRDVLQHVVNLRLAALRSPPLEALPDLPVADQIRSLSPLIVASIVDDPVLQLACAWKQASVEVGRPERFRTTTQWDRGLADPPRLKVGYLSSDLREHAVGYLIAELFALHDRARVEPIVYAAGPPSHDAIATRIRGTVDDWVEIGGLSDADAADRIERDGIHILVDLNGHTKDARIGVLAMRPAPIIVNWLGFPGSMGTPFHDYIIADPVIVPPEAEIHYSETVVRLPCYQPNDRQRPGPAAVPSRSEAGLPDGAVVFCNFNGIHKFTPPVLARWATILREVPGSILWLMRPSQAGIDGLHAIFAAHGVAPSRIVFADRRPIAEHLARLPLADVCLDTFPYGAHTTASDALWCGVPLVTMPGRSFASRVGASLARAAGTEDTVCADPAAYVACAVALGRDPARREALRARLRADRDGCLLFDTPRLVRALEDLFVGMWADVRAGRRRRPDLTNMDAYLAIGASLDPTRDWEPAAALHEAYRRRLAAMHAWSPLPPDTRLWPAGAAEP